MVSDSVSEKIGIEKSIGFGIGKNLVSKKVSESVSKIFGIGKKIRILFRSDFGYCHTLTLTQPFFRGFLHVFVEIEKRKAWCR